MIGLHVRPGWLGILACLVSLGKLGAAETRVPVPLNFSPLTSIEDVPEQYQSSMRSVLDSPTMRIRGPVETFLCEPHIYRWLLDHPDRTVAAWSRMGAKCSPITDRGNGRFGCKDGIGSDVHWDTVVREGNKRIWYAEGVVKPSLLLPSVPVRAILVLHIVEGCDIQGRKGVRHQAELILHTNSKAAALVTRILGASAPRVAEQYVGQIQTFFAAMAWYLGEHPERTRELLED
jgi:hypothetical protein